MSTNEFWHNHQNMRIPTLNFRTPCLQCWQYARSLWIIETIGYWCLWKLLIFMQKVLVYIRDNDNCYIQRVEYTFNSEEDEEAFDGAPICFSFSLLSLCNNICTTSGILVFFTKVSFIISTIWTPESDINATVPGSLYQISVYHDINSNTITSGSNTKFDIKHHCSNVPRSVHICHLVTSTKASLFQDGIEVYPAVPGLDPSPYYHFRLRQVEN